jgi:hypothetical protein
MAKLSIVDILDQRRIFSHIIFFTLSLLTVVIVSWKSGMMDMFPDMVRFFFILFLQLEVFIFIASIIFRELSVGLTKKEFTRIIVTRFLIFFIVCFCAAFIIFLSFRYAVALSEHNELSDVWGNIVKYDLKSWLKSTLKGLSLGAVIFVVIQWQDALSREQKLREESLIFQNETLKNQVNPHFLFNSLNTLSSLIKHDPETAEHFTSRLASIYRYILENSSHDKVPLEKELTFIQNYFYLHRVRDDNKISLEVNVNNKHEFQILPVSLQILVENAIKHNMATREKPLKIEAFEEDDFIVVRNNVQKMSTSLKTTKIGLKNLNERVRIVTGKLLVIEESDMFFTVKVPLMK